MSSAAAVLTEEPVSRIRWPAIIAGAVAAAGVSFTLHAFAAGIGLSVLSAAPTWRESSAALWSLSGIYVVFASVCAFAVGGYIAGRMRRRLSIDSTEVEGIDGMHGLITWALAVVIAAILAVVVFSYRQTIAAYPVNGGSYTVAKENLGTWPGLLAAAALMIDYVLNVAVGNELIDVIDRRRRDLGGLERRQTFGEITAGNELADWPLRLLVVGQSRAVTGEPGIFCHLGDADGRIQPFRHRLHRARDRKPAAVTGAVDVARACDV